MKTLTFNSTFAIVRPFCQSVLPNEEVKSEPMFFNSTVMFALKHGGPITKNFLSEVLKFSPHWENGVFDSRVHMLMRGWYPCIPGWHHDDVPRTRSDGQPDYSSNGYRAEHVMGLVNGHICPTKFIFGTTKLKEVPIGKTVYQIWNKEINRQVKRKKIKEVSIPSGQLVCFDWESFHTGVPAISAGWRWFGRLTGGTGRKPTNEIRKQVQVYLKDVDAGW